MTREEFLEAVENLNVWKRGGRRAPHKPLLLLLALGRISEGRERLVRYAELETNVRRLLKRFGPPHGMNQPELPFWHLQSDGLWEIPGGEGLPKKKGGSSVPAPALRKLDVRGGLPAEVDRLLRGDRELVEAAVAALLNGHFPDSFHTPIRDAVGLLEPMAMEPPSPYGSAPARKRDPRFRRAVLTAYERRCAVCDFDVRLDDDLLGLDAAPSSGTPPGGRTGSRTDSRSASSTTTRSTGAPSGSTRPPTSDSRCSFPRNSVGPARTSSGSWTLAGDRYVSRRTTPSYRILPSWPGTAGGVPRRTASFLIKACGPVLLRRFERCVCFPNGELPQGSPLPVSASPGTR